jgi:hypothetical protein
MDLQAMNTITRLGVALMVVAVLLFPIVGQCFATPAAAMSHKCCQAPPKAKCKMASCCESTTSTSAPVSVGIDNRPPLAALSAAGPTGVAVPAHKLAEPGRLHLPANDRFIVLHQFLI